jgi:hypothetical protein
MTIRQLFDHYGSNKGPTYEGLYDIILEPIKHQIKHLVEIGIGTLNPKAVSTMVGFTVHDQYKPGGSLRAFRDFCPNVHVWGIDVEPDTQFEEDRITTFLFDSADSDKVKENFPFPVDVVIDDGLHTTKSQLATFVNFLPILKVGGLYFLEDIVENDCEHLIRSVVNAYGHVDFTVHASKGDWHALVIRKEH